MLFAKHSTRFIESVCQITKECNHLKQFTVFTSLGSVVGSVSDPEWFINDPDPAFEFAEFRIQAKMWKY